LGQNPQDYNTMQMNAGGRNTVMTSLNSNLNFQEVSGSIGPKTSIGGFKTSANPLTAPGKTVTNNKKAKAKSKSKGASHREKNR
jgi:hypothetical protein